MKYSGLCILPLPFEQSSFAKQGTRYAPEILLNELAYLDTFDFELGVDPLALVPRTILAPHKKDLLDPSIQQKITVFAMDELLDKNNFIIAIGGEHSISKGPVVAHSKRGELGVIQLDSRANLYNEYSDSTNHPYCIMRRIHEVVPSCIGIGMRTVNPKELDYALENKIPLIHAKEVINTNQWYHLINSMPQRIYLTIDMHFFDPLVAPGVSSPLMGGPKWDDCTRFLNYLFENKTVIGADIVELNPRQNCIASIRLATRLLTRILGLALNH